jgi:hypothetical protein
MMGAMLRERPRRDGGEAKLGQVVTVCDHLPEFGRGQLKRKSSGKRPRFLLTAWFRASVGTPYAYRPIRVRFGGRYRDRERVALRTGFRVGFRAVRLRTGADFFVAALRATFIGPLCGL